MNICSWNVRGFKDPNKMKAMKQLVKKHKIQVITLIETKVREGNGEKVKKNLGNRWNWSHNYLFSHKGRLWVGWDSPYVNVIVVSC